MAAYTTAAIQWLQLLQKNLARTILESIWFHHLGLPPKDNWQSGETKNLSGQNNKHWSARSFRWCCRDSIIFIITCIKHGDGAGIYYWRWRLARREALITGYFSYKWHHPAALALLSKSQLIFLTFVRLLGSLNSMYGVPWHLETYGNSSLSNACRNQVSLSLIAVNDNNRRLNHQWAFHLTYGLLLAVVVIKELASQYVWGCCIYTFSCRLYASCTSQTDVLPRPWVQHKMKPRKINNSSRRVHVLRLFDWSKPSHLLTANTTNVCIQYKA